jgi:hypothetical protein
MVYKVADKGPFRISIKGGSLWEAWEASPQTFYFSLSLRNLKMNDLFLFTTDMTDIINATDMTDISNRYDRYQ